MPHSRQDPLFDRPGVGAVAQHLEIVIRFQQQQIQGAELLPYVRRDVAEVGGKAQTDPLGGEDKAHGIGRVMRNCKGAKADVADGEGLAGLEVFDGRKPGGIVLERGRTAIRGIRGRVRSRVR